MKKIVVWMTLLISISMVGCNPYPPRWHDAENTKDKDQAKEGVPEDMTSVSFDAEVITVEDGRYLVFPLEGSEELNSSDQFTVSIKNVDSSIEPEPGDIIRIVYDGEIQETYPAQIQNVYSIKVVEEKVDEYEAVREVQLVMVDGKLYYGLGKLANQEERCGIVDGTIETTVEAGEIPANNNESNFGTGYKYQTGSVQGTIDVFINDAWWIFAEKDSENLLEENTYGIDLFMTNITNKGATVICSQSGGYPTGVLQTGSWYAVETVNKDGVWEELNWKNDNIAWTEEAYIIAKDNVLELEVNWSYLYGELGPGKYRLVKEIMDFRGPGIYDTKLHYAEFEIQ